MSGGLVRRSAMLALMVAVSSPALAGSGSKSKKDPDKRVICKVERGSTSRIASSKRCQTAAEWDLEHKRQQALHGDREDMLLRNPQESTGTLGVPADLRGSPATPN
ncbi:MAG TPA: hypothetical protein VF650_06160 [Allosphingosinicella sp.]